MDPARTGELGGKLGAPGDSSSQEAGIGLYSFDLLSSLLYCKLGNSGIDLKQINFNY